MHTCDIDTLLNILTSFLVVIFFITVTNQPHDEEVELTDEDDDSNFGSEVQSDSDSDQALVSDDDQLSLDKTDSSIDDSLKFCTIVV